MLTDVAVKALKPKEKDYKVADRDGMYVHVTTKGALSFRMDYRLNGRRETIYLGKYGPDGLSLARAREKCIDARRNIADGISPAIEKQREKRRLKESKSFGEFGEKWLTAAPMADSTRAMRRSIFERELLPVWRNRLLTEISPDDLRAHCASIVDRGAPATAIHVRDNPEADLRVCDPPRREGCQSRRRGWPCIYRDLYAEGSVAVSFRDSGSVQSLRVCHQIWDSQKS